MKCTVLPLELLLLIYSIIIISNIFNTSCIGLKSIVANAALLSGIKLSGNGIEDQTVFPEYKTISGSNAELPCNVSLPSSDDAITLILWYRGNSSRTPIYSVDARQELLSNATHFRGDIFSGNRASFDLSVRPALLKIDPVLEDDGMEYRCRVDFRWGRTMNSHVFLNVVVPPRSIVIRDSNGSFVHNQRIGPYNQDIDVMLSCEAEGGIPPPALHWYRDNVMIDGSYIINNNGMAHNDLIVYKLSRNDLNVMFICQANNFNYTYPIRASVSIDINLSPLSVSITTLKNVLSAGRKIEIVCESRGSRPPAVITWFKNNKQLTHSQESVSSDGNITTSVLNLMPTINDNDAFLICRAQNLRLSNQFIENGWKLHVYYDPQMTLTIGKSTKTVILKEGSEALMECQIKANPIASDIQFLLNGWIISDDKQNGIFIDNSTLYIEKVEAEHRGRYKCSSTNLEGKGDSNEVMLDVRYPPICKNSPIKATFAMALNETLNLKCIVDAQPIRVSFYWTFNNYELPNNYSTKGLISELSFTTRSKLDFGILSCWAKNDIGLQRDPCLFVITTAGPPSPLSGCIATNKTMTTITIDCISGDSGGLQQTFYAQVYDSKYKTLVKNITVSTAPIFFINRLSSETQYVIIVFAINSKGKSTPTKIIASTLSMLNTKLVSGSHQELEYDPILAIIIGALLSLLLVVLIVIIICKIKEQDDQKDRRDQQIQQNTFLSNRAQSDSHINSEETRKNPDVVPCDQQSMSDSKLELYIISELQTTTLPKPKSILINGFIPNGDCVNRSLKTNEDSSDQILYYKTEADVLDHRTKFEEFDGTDVQQTAV